MTISYAKARGIAALYHSSSPSDRNITALSHGCVLPDGAQGLISELERDLHSALGDDPENARELRALLDYARSIEKD